MDKVSFKAIQNTGSALIKTDLNKGIVRLVTQLTDEETPDGSQFRDVFERFPDHMGKGYLKIDACFSKPEGIVFVEDIRINEKRVELSNETALLLKKIMKLLNKIQIRALLDIILGMREMTTIQREYIYGDDCLKNFKIDESSLLPIELEAKLIEAHDLSSIQSGANFLEKTIGARFNLPCI